MVAERPSVPPPHSGRYHTGNGTGDDGPGRLFGNGKLKLGRGQLSLSGAHSNLPVWLPALCLLLLPPDRFRGLQSVCWHPPARVRFLPTYKRFPSM